VRLPTMTVVGKNRPRPSQYAYDQQTRSGRRLSRGRLLLYKLTVPIAFGLGRLVWSWTRVVRVVGAEHIEAALARAPSFVPSTGISINCSASSSSRRCVPQA